MAAFATPAVEAFTLLYLENNEEDWLHEAKKVLWRGRVRNKGGRKKAKL